MFYLINKKIMNPKNRKRKIHELENIEEEKKKNDNIDNNDIIKNEENKIRCKGCTKFYPLSHFISLKNGAQTKKCQKCRDISARCRKSQHSNASKIRQHYINLKRNLPPCVMCGDDNPNHKEFDHINPADKLCIVGNCRSIEQMENEAKKCQSVCRKCHVKKSISQKRENMSDKTKNSLCYKNKQRKRKYVNDIKIKIGKCQMEGCNDTFDLENLEFYDFDHLDPKDKFNSVSYMVTSHSLDRIQEEIKKCRLLCGYCHRTHSLEQQKDMVEIHKSYTEPITKKAKKYPSKRIFPPSTTTKKLTIEQVNLIRKEWNVDNFTLKCLSEKYNVSSKYIEDILKNRVYYDASYIKTYQGKSNNRNWMNKKYNR